VPQGELLGSPAKIQASSLPAAAARPIGTQLPEQIPMGMLMLGTHPASSGALRLSDTDVKASAPVAPNRIVCFALAGQEEYISWIDATELLQRGQVSHQQPP
jgi:hypothetical protein